MTFICILIILMQEQLQNASDARDKLKEELEDVKDDLDDAQADLEAIRNGM